MVPTIANSPWQIEVSDLSGRWVLNRGDGVWRFGRVPQDVGLPASQRPPRICEDVLDEEENYDEE